MSARQTNAHIAAWLFCIVALSAIVRVLVATRRTTPLYYPDEYLYAALERSIASSGIPQVRGASAHFPAVLGPYLVAPAWLIHSVDVAYHVALGWGALWFSAAAVPAYFIARAIGVSTRGSLVVAVLSVLVPDVAFTTTLLTEPYAYPVFLAATVVAVHAIASPTRLRQVAVLALMLALVLIRVQFVAFLPIYIVAALVCAGSVGALVRRQPIVVAASTIGGVVLLLAGTGAVGVYAGITTYPFRAEGSVQWFGLNAFVLAISAGWVVVPGAVCGLAALVRSSDPRSRAFAVLSVCFVVGLLAQAAFFGAAEDRAHERYAFYCVPLLAAAFLWSVEQLDRGTLYRATAYALAAAAILLPLGHALQTAATDESPTLLGLRWLAGGGRAAPIVWGLVLTALAVVTGLRVVGSRVTIATAIVCMVAIGAAGTRELLGFGTSLGFQLGASVTRLPRFEVGSGAGILTTPATNRFLLMETLFWNPHVTRVLVLGGKHAADGYVATQVRLAPSGRLIGPTGKAVDGELVVDADTSVATPPPGLKPGHLPAGAPVAILFGLNRDDHYLQTVSTLVAASGRRPQVVTLWIRSPSGHQTLLLDCGGRRVRVRATGSAAPVRIAVPGSSKLRCRVSLIGGLPIALHHRTVSAQVVAFTIRPGR